MQIRSLILTSLFAVLGACVVEAGAPDDEAAVESETQAATIRPFPTGAAHGLVIHRKESTQVIPASAISGGTIRADAHGVSYGRFSVEIPWTNALPILSEVLSGGARPYEAVDLVDANFSGIPVRGRKLKNALITSIKIPDLDAASKEALNKITIELLPQDGFDALKPEELPGKLPGGDGHFPGGFKIAIAGLDMAKASKVTGIVWQQELQEDGLITLAQPELAITVTNVGGQGDSLYAAFKAFNVFNGSDGLTGSLQLLASTDLSPMLTLSFSDVQFTELGDVPPSSNDSVSQLLFKTKIGNVDSIK